VKLTPDEEFLNKLRTDFLFFVKNVIEFADGEGPTPQQEQLLNLVSKMVKAKIASAEGRINSLSNHERSLSKKIGIAIKSGHGTGKDTCLSWIYYCLMVCYPFFRGLVTAPTAAQLKRNLWSEFSKWRRKSKIIQESIEIETDLVYNREHKKEWFIQSRTCNPKSSEDEQAETLSGTHSKYMLVGIDEASSVPRPVFKPLESTLTGFMNFALMIGNPTRGHGYFYDAFNNDIKNWETITWSSEESPIVSRDFIERMESKYGKDSNMYRVRVLGEFPITDTTSLIPYSWVMAAVDREIEIDKGAPIIKGIDVGGSGDPSIILTREGSVVTDIREFSNPDTMETAAWIMKELVGSDYNIAYIDPIGLGAGVYDRLRQWGVRDLEPIDVRMESSNPDYFRLRDELFMRVREKFERGIIKIPDDLELIGELSTIRYDDPDRTKGKIKIESKHNMRKRNVESPNKADALAYTYRFDDVVYQNMPDVTHKQRPITPNWKVI
jgi:hypothetical protein